MPERLGVREASQRRALCTCQGCGAVRFVAPDTAHACWRNEDGTYEEGGTFQ